MIWMIKMLLVAVIGLASFFGLPADTFITASFYGFAGCLAVMVITCLSVLADVLYLKWIRGELRGKV